LSTDQVLLSPIHAYYHSIEQINGGRNDMFAAMSTVGGYTMGYFDGSGMKLWQWAKEFTLADNFFMGAFGGSYLNHQYLICACTPAFKDAPPQMRAQLDANGRLEKKPESPSARDGAVCSYTRGLAGHTTPDGLSANTTQPPYQPSGIAPATGGPLDLADAKGTERLGLPLPPQTSKTIGDTLSAKGIAGPARAAECGTRGQSKPSTSEPSSTACEQGPQFPAAPSAVQLFRRPAPGRRIATCI
jgi:phospholipase C